MRLITMLKRCIGASQYSCLLGYEVDTISKVRQLRLRNILKALNHKDVVIDKDRIQPVLALLFFYERGGADTLAKKWLEP